MLLGFEGQPNNNMVREQRKMATRSDVPFVDKMHTTKLISCTATSQPLSGRSSV